MAAALCFRLWGAESPFGYFPRHVALLVGIASALILAPGVKISEKVDVLTENMGRSGVMMIVLIYLMASGFQGAAAAIGGKTSVINLCLHYIPVKLLVPGVFMMCCFISTAIGTSMGTMAAMAPVALGVAEGAGLNPAIVCAAVIGGSYFGDNLSMISDTTIAAAEGCGSEMRDKFRMNFFIAFPAAVLSLIFYGFICPSIRLTPCISITATNIGSFRDTFCPICDSHILVLVNILECSKSGKWSFGIRSII